MAMELLLFAIFSEYSNSSAREELMPFPGSKQAPVQAQNCTAGNLDARDNLFARINWLADQLDGRIEMPDAIPSRAAAIIYLGLCRLKHASETGLYEEWKDRCRQIEDDLSPGQGNKGVNCSYFCGGPLGKVNYSGHLRAINSAMGIYMPGSKSVKKRSLVLLAVGSFHLEGESPPIPETDEWVVDYKFPLPS